MNRKLQVLLLGFIVGLTGCADAKDPFGVSEVPTAENYCVAAQRLVTKTNVAVELVIHSEFDAFVKSKAIIDGPNGPQIQQYNWQDSTGKLQGVSCKLKSADHLNLEFGPGSAGPDGACQDMNRAVFGLVARGVREPTYSRVTFDSLETVTNEDEPGMVGPDWLAPFTMTYVDDSGALHVATKGFIVNFTDPQYEKAPARFRGVHYCHLIAPEYLQALMEGSAEAGVTVGAEVDRSGPPPS